MSTDTAKRLAQAEAENAILRAQLAVAERQRNDAQSDSVVKLAAARVERDAIVGKANAALVRLNAELNEAQSKVAALESAALEKVAAEPASPVPPEVGKCNGAAAESSPPAA